MTAASCTGVARGMRPGTGASCGARRWPATGRRPSRPTRPGRRPGKASFRAASACNGGMADIWQARQFHNQPEESHQHPFLVDLWQSVREQTAGRFDCRVYAQNANVAGSDPAVLKMLVEGELEFFTQMGGILGQIAPVMEIQGLPFAFTSSEQVYRVMDGELGAHLRRELAAKGIHSFAQGRRENGFRHTPTPDRPTKTGENL